MPSYEYVTVNVFTGTRFAGNPLAQNFANKLLMLIDGRSVYTPLYSGIYSDGVCLREALVTRDQLLALLSLEPTPIVVACETAIAESLCAPFKLGLGGNATPQIVAEPTATDALPLALARIQQRAFDDPATIDANYLRRTDAEIFAKPIAPAVSPPLPTRSRTPTR